MANGAQEAALNLVMDPENLYREESFTDMKVGAVRQLSPVKADGTPDPDRQPVYYGHTQLMSPEGPLPVSCGIEAGSLAEAMAKFPGAMKQEIENIMAQVQKAQQDEEPVAELPVEEIARHGVGENR